MKKLLVLYVSHVYNTRVKHFIENAMFEDPNIDWIFISNGLEMNFPLPSYVKVLKRENIGFDFGGWQDAIFLDDNTSKYEKYIFVNSSVYGPYLPKDFKGKWTDIYLNGLKDNIKLFGSTINTVGSPETRSHVQSYIFSIDNETLQYLIKCGIFNNGVYVSTFQDAIWKKEVAMSGYIIENGWNIGCLWRRFDGVDFTFKTKPISDYDSNKLNVNDIMFHCYEGREWTREELVFVKGNRLGIE